jgi:hypothetical protein
VIYDRAFASVCDTRYLCGLWALLNSIVAYYGNELRVFLALHSAATSETVEALARHPVSAAVTWITTDEFAGAPKGVWEAKQLLLNHLAGRATAICLLDADLVLTSRLDDVFEAAESGRIVSSRDGVHDREFGPEYAAYSPSIVGRRFPYFNSGFICLDLVRHWDVAALWAFTARFASYSPGGGPPYHFPGYGDQGHLNAVTALLGKEGCLEVFPQDEWCNSDGWGGARKVSIQERDGDRLLVMNSETGRQQRLIHSSGPKWWTEEGRAHFSTCGDVYRCFEHFADHPAKSPFTWKPEPKGN